MINSIEEFLDIGCGRCPLVGTPDCKVQIWQDEIVTLREIILKSELKEELKWSNPCYTFDGNNVLMLSALKNYAVIGFFKGTLLDDHHNLLESPGKNSQAVMRLTFTDTAVIQDQEQIILDYISQAIEIEKKGLKVEFKKEPEPIPEELESVFENDPALKSAFFELTPGRQRGYILHFSQAKQAKTRFARIEKCIPKIMEGKGFHDR
ncbi:MAG: YdeI/OmpD-associated family protein [Balneolaceae bacterium]|nr:YdeI/OmpD-associated family protein [Balneolaceae bacterium]